MSPYVVLEIMEKVNEMTEGDVRVGAEHFILLPRFENIGYIQLLKKKIKKNIHNYSKGKRKT